MKDLHNKLHTLCIFRPLLADPVITALCTYLWHPSAPAYAGFVAALYEANGGNLAEHIKDLCNNSENVYVKAIAGGKGIPRYLHETLLAELEILEQTAALTKEGLCQGLSYDGFLPEFSTTRLRLTDIYLHRTENIQTYGYGIYAKNRMFYLDPQGNIQPVRNPDSIRIEQLVDYERERQLVLDNTRALLAGKPAANMLLTGDAGTGKSSTVKAVVNALWKEGLRLVEIRKDQLHIIPMVLDTLSANPLKFILFIDDLSFRKDDDHFSALKAVLEGSVTAKAKNTVIYATSNRRHLIKETFSDRDGDDIHRNDTMQEMISLSERFGLHITFSRPNRQTYLRIVHALAKENSMAIPDRTLEQRAEQYALERGGRSARLARQFIDRLLSE